MIIIVTGTPGTGKTKLAKKLAKIYKLNYLDVNELIKKYKLYDSYDRKLKTYIVNTNKLNKFLVKLIRNGDYVIDSHLSHYLGEKYVDLCIVAKCDIKILKKRLEKRKYSQKKIRENLDSEIFDVCLVEAEENGHKVRIVDTSRGIKKEDLEMFKKSKRSLIL